MEFEPKQKNKAPDVLIPALFFCALVCVVFGNISGIKYRGILQSIAVLFFAGLIFVLVKYKFTRLRYTVRKKAPKGYGDEDEQTLSDDGTPVLSYPPEALELIVETAQGKRTFIAEAAIALDEISEFGKVPEIKTEKKALKEKYKKTQKYKYLRNMVGADEYYLAAKTSMGDVLITFEPGEKMAEYLSAVARYNREKNDGQ